MTTQPAGAQSPSALTDALLGYTQADEHGVIVFASRQACDEAAALIESQAARIAHMEAIINEATTEAEELGRPEGERLPESIIAIGLLVQSAHAALAEHERNANEYERILGKRSYQEVADTLEELEQKLHAANLHCIGLESLAERALKAEAALAEAQRNAEGGG